MPGHAILATWWYLGHKSSVPETPPSPVPDECQLYINGDVRSLETEGRILTVDLVETEYSSTIFHDLRKVADGLGIPAREFLQEHRSTLMLAFGRTDLDVPDYAVVAVASTDALARVVVCPEKLKAEVQELVGVDVSHMYVFTERDDSSHIVGSYQARLFNLDTTQEEPPTGIEAALVPRYLREHSSGSPEHFMMDVYHLYCGSREECVVRVYPNMECPRFGGEITARSKGMIQLDSVGAVKKEDSGSKPEGAKGINTKRDDSNLSRALTPKKMGLLTPEPEFEEDTAFQVDSDWDDL